MGGALDKTALFSFLLVNSMVFLCLRESIIAKYLKAGDREGVCERRQLFLFYRWRKYPRVVGARLKFGKIA